jgi:hypothetical protein
MTDPAAAPDSASPRPRPVGRIPYYILLGAFLLALAVTAFYIATDSDSIPVGFVFVGFVGLLLTALPPVQFLLYFWFRQPPDVPPRTRRSIYASSGALVVIGGFYAWASLSAEEPAFGAAAIGIAGALLGLAAIVLLVRFARRAGAAAPSERQLVYTRFNGVGLVFFLIAVIVIPKFACGCGEDSHKALVKSDLRNLVTAEEAFFADSTRYGYNRDLGTNYAATTGDSIAVQFASAKGFRAIGWHANYPGTRCGVWVGVAPPDGMHGAAESEPRCWTEKQR